MHALALPLILAAPVSLALPGDDADESADIGRLVDLRHLDLAAPPLPDDGDARLRRMLPFLRFQGPSYESMEFDPDGEDSHGHAVDLVLDLFVNHHDDISQVEFVEPGVLYMEAPAGTHERLVAFIAFVGRAMRSGPRIRVTHFAAPHAHMEAARARGDDSWRASSVVEQTRSIRELKLPAATPTRVLELEHHTVAARVDVEIAKGISVADTKVEEVPTGLDLELMGSWTGESLRLAYVVTDTERRDRSDVMPVAAPVLTTAEQRGIMYDRNQTWEESFGISGGALSGTAALRQGETVLLCARSDGETGEYIAIEVLSGPPTLGFHELSEDSLLWAGPRGAFRPARARVTGGLGDSDGGLDVEEGYLDSHDGTVLGARLVEGWGSALDVTVGQLGASELHEAPGVTLMVVDREERDRVERTLGFLLGDAPRVLAVRVSATSSSGANQVLGELELADGDEGAAALGYESLAVKDDDVEVAQDSATRDPSITTVFDGLACSMTLQVLADGSLAYAIQGQLNRELDRRPGAVEASGLEGAVATRTLHLGLAERGVAEARSPGVWRLVLGDRSGNGVQVVFDVRAR